MRLRSKFAVKCAKATSSLIKKLNRGSGVTLPGYVARLIDPNILKELSGQVRKKTIVTMGTNGKTTTNAILCKALEHEGQKVIINRTGANMLNGIISAFVLATDKHGNLDADYACIEVDEIASVGVLPKIEPDCALLTNISRDQLDRFGEVDITYNKLMTAVTSVPKTTLIINCDDILSYSLAQESKNAFVTYGISEQIFDDVSRSEIRESIFCRKCGKKLEYQFFHYGQLGLYHCPNCGWNRPNPEYTAEHVVREDELYSFDMDGIHFDPQIRTPYNIYNTLSAYAALKTMGAGYEHFKEMIEAFDYGNNRESIFNINGARVQLHLAKNPIGFQQKVSHVLRDPNPKDIIIQINDTYQDGEDVSWLWDVDFQYLAESNARKIITAGTRKYDMALRLKYEDVSCESTDDMRASVLEAEVIPFLSGEKIDFSKLDIVLLGGGSDREQELVCGFLKDIKDDFKAYVEDGGVVLAVCGGYQLLGKYYKTNKKTIEGLSILDITTEWQPERLIRNIVLNSPLFEQPVVGFENHGGRTYIGDHTPFGKVFYGLGNTGKSGYEGVIYKNVIATYLHGPLLPKNPQVCDYLLEKALQRKYGEEVKLEPLKDETEKKANSYIADRYSDKKYVLRETVKRHT